MYRLSSQQVNSKIYRDGVLRSFKYRAEEQNIKIQSEEEMKNKIRTKDCRGCLINYFYDTRVTFFEREKDADAVEIKQYNKKGEEVAWIFINYPMKKKARKK